MEVISENKRFRVFEQLLPVVVGAIIGLSSSQLSVLHQGNLQKEMLLLEKKYDSLERFTLSYNNDIASLLNLFDDRIFNLEEVIYELEQGENQALAGFFDKQMEIVDLGRDVPGDAKFLEVLFNIDIPKAEYELSKVQKAKMKKIISKLEIVYKTNKHKETRELVIQLLVEYKAVVEDSKKAIEENVIKVNEVLNAALREMEFNK